jgi:hypothetical protein
MRLSTVFVGCFLEAENPQAREIDDIDGHAALRFDRKS